MSPVRRGVCGTWAVLCSLVLAACGGPAGHGGPLPSGTSSAPPGVVRGQVVRPPGGDPRSGNVGGSGTAVPVNGDYIEASDERAQVVATAVTAIGGSFELVLAPGTYRITEGICGVSQKVEVRSQVVTPLVLSIPNAC